MASNRKLNRPTDQRNAVLRGLVTALIANGRIETTEARAKEVRSAAEHLITLAIRECDNTVSVEKTFNNDKGQSVTVTVQNDAPSKLHARRQIMAYLYDVKEPKQDEESKKAYAERTKDAKYPCVEKTLPRDRAEVQGAQRREELRRRLHPYSQEGPAPRRRRRDGHSRADLIPFVTEEAVSPRRGAASFGIGHMSARPVGGNEA